jgi:hypothetical protein
MPAPTLPATPSVRSRVLPALVVVTLLYLALDIGLFSLFSAQADRLAPRADRLAPPAAEVGAVAQASAAADARLGPAARTAAWQLGPQVGAAAQQIGLVMQQPALWQQQVAAARQRVAQAGFDALLGVAPAPLITPRHWADFSALARLVEEDSGGLAARIEAVTSARHRHLYQAGALLGGQAWLAQQGLADDAPQAPAAIARHLALAGLPPAVWTPLVGAPQGATPQARAAAVAAALQAVDSALRRACQSLAACIADGPLPACDHLPACAACGLSPVAGLPPGPAERPG